MPANFNPVYALTPKVGIAVDMTAANATIDITTGTSYLVFTAGANGAWVKDIVIKPNPSQNTAATVARLWYNDGGLITTVTTSSLIKDITIPAITASATVAITEYIIALNRALPATSRLYITLGTAPGGSGEFTATAFGGDY